MHTCMIFLKTIPTLKSPRACQAVLCSPCALCGRWACASPSNTACPSSLCTSSGWCPPTTAASCLDGPAGPAWRREGGPSVPSLATWLPRGEGGVEGGGAEEAGQQEKKTFPLLSPSLVFSQGLLFCHPLLSCSFFFRLSHFPLTSIVFIAHWF